ncbi:thioesterase II family protein [Saccharophagus degradans]|uniref:Thioesterase domain-containing protein n=1 Tax=Saccharophagus degradans TaxID=86304 RepID=A0AAW7XC25_9GAMM|nr:thioesterase domain-containing protein [Saccharophagus degradans]MDO6424486.1 thioesterase domain-containing protein [Saccharophagus degradans]MDO6608891.1 thioesterase domain-containing protein [Saccharophagus degradans]
MIKTTENKYFICFRPRKTVRKKVICFPPAGVGASFYSKWHQRVPDDVEIWAAQLPGREFKSEQAMPTFLKALVGAFVEDISELTQGDYEFYGHSFGAAQAILVAQRLRAKQGPSRIVVAARRPVHLPYTVELSQQSDTTLFRYLNTLGGISPSVVADKYVLARFMKLVRSDLALNEQAYSECDGLVACPIEFVAADGDIAISIKESERWGELTKKGFKLHLVEGDHFFVNDPEHAFYSQIYSSKNALETTKKVQIDEFFTS